MPPGTFVRTRGGKVLGDLVYIALPYRSFVSQLGYSGEGWCGRAMAEHLLYFGKAYISSVAAAPFVRLGNVFSEPQVAEFLDLALNRQSVFRPARVGEGTIDRSKRETLVLKDIGAIRTKFIELIHARLPFVFERLCLRSFDVGKIEVKMTNHLDGGFFKTHADNSTKLGRSGRMISFCYYFSQSPKRFQGGDLLLFDTEQGTSKVLSRSDEDTMLVFDDAGGVSGAAIVAAAAKSG